MSAHHLDAELKPALSWLAAIELAHMLVMLRADPMQPLLYGAAALIVIGVLRGWVLRALFWAALLALGVLVLALDPLEQANHHGLLLYIKLCVLICATHQGVALAYLSRSARGLFLVVMGMATLQKFLSPTFRDGSFMGYLWATGGFAQPVLARINPARRVSAQNLLMIDEMMLKPPPLLRRLFWPWPISLELWGLAWAWATLAVELALVCLVWRWPGRRATHVALCAFLVCLGPLRQELVFLSLVAWLGALISEGFGQQPKPSHDALQITYKVLIGVALCFCVLSPR